MLLIYVLGCTGEPVIIGGGSSDTAVDTEDTQDTEVIDTGNGSDTGETDTDTAEDDDTGKTDEQDAAYEAFYAIETIQQVVIEIDGASIAAMDAEAAYQYSIHPSNPQLTYFHGVVSINGEVLGDIGIRLKGSSTFQYWSSKPSLKLKFNEWDDTFRYAGLKRATLNNMTGDPAMAREVIGYKLWHDAGMAVPRANFAQLYVVVDGGEPEYYGLYTNLEAMDSEWIERNYEDDLGDLWEGNDSSDFNRQGISHLELVVGPGDTQALDDARDAVQNHGDDFYADANEFIDMDQFLEFWTLSVAIGNRDGYPYNLNDFFVYRDPTEGKFNFSPWGMDETWDTATPAYYGYVGGDIAEQCLYYDDTCPARFFEAASASILTYEGADLPTLAQEMFDLTEQAMADDTHKNWAGYAWTTANVRQYRDTLAYRIEMYPVLLRNRMGID